jgi:predicted ATP-dependent endonuclease of OLD family
MELNRIIIKNFRSIKDSTIYFDQNCKILIGKNEVGKSNILKAIAALFGKYVVSSKDKRKRIKNEEIKDDDFILSAVYKLNDIDFLNIFEFFLKRHPNLKELDPITTLEIKSLIRVC